MGEFVPLEFEIVYGIAIGVALVAVSVLVVWLVGRNDRRS